MMQDAAEKQIKGLQKQFLIQIEEHPVFQHMGPTEFNDLRKRVFRGTFEAYRLGIVGIDGVSGRSELFSYFFHWLNDSTATMTHALQVQVAEMCFRVALESYRIGSMVAAERAKVA